jgi:predicted permease
VRSIGTDLAFVLRRVRVSPFFSLVLVLTMAVGLGSTLALLSLIDALHRPLEIPDPENLVAVSEIDTRGQTVWMPLPTVEEFARHQRVLESPFAYSGRRVVTTEVGGRIFPSSCAFASGGYYGALGASAATGRLLFDVDASLGGQPAAVVVLSHRLWQQRFAGSPEVVGATIRVEGVPLQIIGVSRAGFRGLDVDTAPDLTVPIGLMPLINGAPASIVRVNYVIGRIPSGGAVSQARAMLEALWPALQEASAGGAPSPVGREDAHSLRPRIEPIASGFSVLRRDFSTPLRMLTALAGILLLLGCINVGGLLIARLEADREAFEVRFALGASRWRIVRLVVVESTLLCSLGAAVSLPVAWAGMRAAVSILDSGFTLPLTLTLDVSARLASWTVAVLIASVAVVGVIPAVVVISWQRSPLFGSVRSVTRSRSQLSTVLTVAQVSLAMILVFGAGLLSTNLSNLRFSHQGFEERHLWWMMLTPSPGGYQNIREEAYYPALVERLEALPGVEAAALSRFFLSGVDPVSAARPVSTPADSGSQSGGRAFVEAVSPRFFETVATPRLSGRDFTWADRIGSPPVAIVNEMLARTLFPGRSALSEFIVVGTADSPPIEVVGVVADATLGQSRTGRVPVVFRPALQAEYRRGPSILLRTSVTPESIAESIRGIVESFGHEYPYLSMPVSGRLDAMLLNERLAAAASRSLAMVAASIAAAGLFALLGYMVARRTREIGVRLALGASWRAIAGLVVRRAAALTLAGITFGVLGAFVTAHVMRAMLFGLSPFHTPTLLGAFIVMVGLGLVAALVPALRACRTNPIVALRAE